LSYWLHYLDYSTTKYFTNYV